MPKTHRRTLELVERARHAAAIRRADTGEPATWRDPYWATCAEACAHRLADILGITREHIVISPDPTRVDDGWVWPRLTVTDQGTAYEFIAANNDPHRLLCLGPCPECGNRVPLTPLRHLADLGELLEHRAGLRRPKPPLAQELVADPAHHSRCPFHRD